MFIFKFLSLNNIISYAFYAIFTIILLFLIYKYLYLEQAIYLINNKLDRYENDFSNNNCCPYNNSSEPNIKLNECTNNNMMRNAEIIMNEIFNIDPLSHHEKEIKSNNIEPIEEIVPVLEEPVNNNNLFDLKRKNVNDKDEKEDKEDKEINDKESVISNIIGGGHAVKKNLMKLSLDKLKTKCEERKLSTEGTKNQLADRIIIYDNENNSQE